MSFELGGGENLPKIPRKTFPPVCRLLDFSPYFTANKSLAFESGKHGAKSSWVTGNLDFARLSDLAKMFWCSL